MDYFNIDLTLKYINDTDKKLIDEMNDITFEYNKLSKEGDKLLQILSYSPKVNKPDKNMIKRLQKINIPELSELKSLNFSLLGANNQILSASIREDENRDMVKDIVISIIDNIFENNNYNILKTEDSDDDEELAKILMKNRKKSEEEEKKRDIEFTATASRLGLEMNLLNQIKVYLFKSKFIKNNNDDYIMINITPKDRIKSIKEKIIKKIIDSKKYILKNTSEEAYEIHLIDEDNKDKFDINSSPLEDNDYLFKEKITSIVFLESKNYISTHINYEEEDSLKIEDEKINLKIYFQKNGSNNSKILVLSKDDTLKSALNALFEQKLLKNKNRNLYYFVVHNQIKDIENKIHLDTNIKYLSSYELDLCLKDYYEIPEIINEYSDDFKTGFDSKKDERKAGGEPSRFNEISGGLYQEFDVFKINKYKKRKVIILGVDMYYLYNNLPKKNNNNGLMNMLFRETKKRKVENILECRTIGEKKFYINIKDENKEQVKKKIYETKGRDIRDEVVDKINFLINYHKKNK